MKISTYLAPIFVFCVIGNMYAQELALFNIYDYGKPNDDTVAFISLSDVYPLSEHPNSLTVPDLRETEIEDIRQFTYITLDSIYRKQFLAKTNVSEHDKVFIYSYLKNKLISLPVCNLKVIVVLSPYADENEISLNFSQYDYSIGFEVPKQFLNDFETYYGNTFVYIGKKSPFVLNERIPITWTRVGLNDFPISSITYDTLYAGKCTSGKVYSFETEDLSYFVKEWISLNDNWIAAKHVLIKSRKTTKTICEKLIYSGESTGFAELDNQWTGKLFKNKPPVILGFTWEAYGCQNITLISPKQREIITNCDNRH